MQGACFRYKGAELEDDIDVGPFARLRKGRIWLKACTWQLW